MLVYFVKKIFPKMVVVAMAGEYVPRMLSAMLA